MKRDISPEMAKALDAIEKQFGSKKRTETPTEPRKVDPHYDHRGRKYKRPLPRWMYTPW